jgi:hypothetical protein
MRGADGQRMEGEDGGREGLERGTGGEGKEEMNKVNAATLDNFHQRPPLNTGTWAAF